MPAIFSDGFESGDLTLWTGTVGASNTVVPAAAHAGAFGARITADGSYTYAGPDKFGATGVLVGQVWFRFHVFPSGGQDTSVLTCGTPGSSFDVIFFRRFGGVDLRAYLGGTIVDTGFTPVLDTWVLLDFRVDVTANPWTLDFRFNGGANVHLTHAAAPTTVNRFTVSSEFVRSGVLDFDQVRLSTTAADYPLAPAQTVAVTPAVETDTALPVAGAKVRALGTAVETDTALPVVAAGGSVAPALYTAAAALLACVRATLAVTVAGVPDRVCLVPGELAWDECDCGLLAVTVGRVYPSSTFPTDVSLDPRQVDCAPPYTVADVTVTVLRCAPTVDEAGNPPTCDDLAAAAATWRADAAAVLTGVACCLPDLVDAGRIEQYRIGDLTPLGPEGGCMGSELRVTIGLCASGVCG